MKSCSFTIHFKVVPPFEFVDVILSVLTSNKGTQIHIFNQGVKESLSLKILGQPVYDEERRAKNIPSCDRKVGKPVQLQLYTLFYYTPPQ